MTWTYREIKQHPKIYLSCKKNTTLASKTFLAVQFPPDYYTGRSTRLEVRRHMFWIRRCFVFSFGMLCFGLLQHVPRCFAPPGEEPAFTRAQMLTLCPSFSVLSTLMWEKRRVYRIPKLIVILLGLSCLSFPHYFTAFPF